jgi:hypothetical protein
MPDGSRAKRNADLVAAAANVVVHPPPSAGEGKVGASKGPASRR